MGRVVRQFFSRDPKTQYVAVRRLKIGEGKYLEPGDNIPDKMFKLYVLRHLYQRRRIGVSGSDWAKEMIKSLGNAHARPEVTSNKPNEEKPTSIALPDGVTIDRKGAGWIDIFLDGEEIDTVRGDDELSDWVKNNGGA